MRGNRRFGLPLQFYLRVEPLHGGFIDAPLQPLQSLQHCRRALRQILAI